MLMNATQQSNIIISNIPSRRNIIIIATAVLHSIQKLNNLLSIRRELLIGINKFISVDIINR